MNHPTCIALLTCSLTVVCAAGLIPFLHSDLRKDKCPRFPVWTVVLAVITFSVSVNALSRLRLNQNQVLDSLPLIAALLGGLCLKWTMETVAQKRFSIHEDVLFRALLAAPLAVALLPKIFGSQLNATGLLLWGLNGFFWQTLFSDFERLLTRERVIIRRREPPTLPHDFRKPEIN